MTFDFAGWLSLAKECRDRARVKRTRGDALRALGKIEEAKKAYREAAEDFREPLNALPETMKGQILNQWPSEMEGWRQKVVVELVELYGSLGGILRRSEYNEEALASYEHGSLVEQKFNISSTYNRLNAIKYKLLTHAATLEQMEQELKQLARHIDQQLAIDSKLSDSAWAWADLGDSRLLTGDLDGAREAYKTFINKAETKSPATALGVLTEIARTLQGATDPKAVQAAKNIDLLKREFA